MEITDLDWNDWNVEHIARHKVRPEEVEEVCYGFHFVRKASGSRYVLSGQSQDGRYLDVVIERVSGSIFRPITAFDMSENYKRSVRQGLKKRRGE